MKEPKKGDEKEFEGWRRLKKYAEIEFELQAALHVNTHICNPN